MKRILLVLVFFGLANSLFAQIGQTLKEVKEKYGQSYTDGYTDPGEDGETFYHISYEEKMETTHSGSYTRIKVMYFFDNTPDSFCAMWMIIEPSSETNPTVRYFNKDMVRVKDMTWKDYETNLLYNIEVVDGFCITTCYPDFNNL